MKKILAFAALSVAFFAGLSWAEDKPKDPYKKCREWYEVKYDKFKDVTLIRPNNLRNERLKVGSDNMGFYISLSFPGKVYDPKKPATLTVVMSDLELSNLPTIAEAKQSPKLLYRDCHTLVILADDERMDFGATTYEPTVSFSGGYAFVDQVMTAPLTLDQLQKLAGAEKVEGQLCESEFVFKEDEKCIVGMALQYLQEAPAAPPAVK